MKKRRSTKGRVNNARATPSLSLRRTVSPRAANQSLRSPSPRLRSKRRRRYWRTSEAFLHYTVAEFTLNPLKILQSSKYEANLPDISDSKVLTRPRGSLLILCRLLSPNLHQRPSRKRARKRKRKCLCWTWMTVSTFSSPGAACSKFNLNRDCSDLSRTSGEGSLISSTNTPKLFSARRSDKKDLLALLFCGCSRSWIRLFFTPLFPSPSRAGALSSSHTRQHLPVQQPGDRPGGALAVWHRSLASGEYSRLLFNAMRTPAQRWG